MCFLIVPAANRYRIDAQPHNVYNPPKLLRTAATVCWNRARRRCVVTAELPAIDHPAVRVG